MKPKLMIVVPCFNEQEVLPKTIPMFLEKLDSLKERELVHKKSGVIFVDDGSRDDTWEIIQKKSQEHDEVLGIKLSRNRGHQNALLCGLMEAKEICDITISIDCDGQDDINAMDKMIEEYLSGAEIVYGVRDNRDTDTFFKRNTAQGFYKLLNLLGAEVVYNHADYRLISSKALNHLAKFKEVNLYLRGTVPMVGFKSTSVYYKRNERLAGKSHYPLKKMLKLAFDGITNLSVKPIHIITTLGFVVTFLSFIGVIWSVVSYFLGSTASGWASTITIICFLGGVQLTSLGVIGEYIGKIYMEVKERPKYIIEEKTWEK